MKIKSNIKYDKNKVGKYHDTRYYEKLQDNIERAQLLKEEKNKFATQNKEHITKSIEEYKKKKDEKSEKIAHKLKTIYEKNIQCAYKNKKVINARLINILASIPLLIISYKKVRKNKGAMTPGYTFSEQDYEQLKSEQRNLYNKTIDAPDGMNMSVFKLASRLIRKGEYPWGPSKRIYFEKPGNTKKKRPITIPPFMDRVVQNGIKMILEAIYEPYFDKLNCSFGFRPGRGCHNAIYAISNRANSTGLWNALEGDIQSAYDKVNRKTLIKILSKKIKDRKFLNLMDKRLEYQYWDTEKEEYIKDQEGLPQGGIDSPYLWNIYFHEFDEYIKTELQNEIDQLNIRRRQNKGRKKIDTKSLPSPRKRYLTRIRQTLKAFTKILNNTNNIEEINDFLKLSTKEKKEKYNLTGELLYFPFIKTETNWKEYYKNKDIKNYKYAVIKLKRIMNHKFHRIADTEKEKKLLRFTYTRYADDFILITNFKLKLLGKIKEKIKIKLKEELHADLSENKTVITDLRIKSAKFLGFEIRTIKNNKQTIYLKDNKKIKGRTASGLIFTYPDKQRLIDRFTTKGFCDETGFPREIRKLAHMETYMIINRFNEIIRGFSLYYTQFVRAPRKTLSFWIYILRFSCLKTLAMKESTNIRGIFKKYKDNNYKKYYKGKKENTIGVNAHLKLDKQNYYKKWRLMVDREAYNFAEKINIYGKIMKQYWQLQKGEIPEYKDIKNPTAIINDKFVDKVDWINLRTQASFDLPCCICGDAENIEMHHIKHVNKSKYKLEAASWEQIMGIKNRKQIPVCKACHIQIIHKGKYGGHTNLSYFKPRIMYDNRLITIEGKISKTTKNTDQTYMKTLTEKGWKTLKETQEK